MTEFNRVNVAAIHHDPRKRKKP